MKNEPLVSILMPAYNAEKFIAEAIGSILDQDHKQWELLIVEDASTDSTRALINSFSDPRIKLFQHDKNQGYLLSCNELFEKAQGEFVTFLDADDTCPKDRLSQCLEAFTKAESLDFLSTDYYRTDEHGNVVEERKQQIDHQRYATDIGYDPIVCCATLFLRISLLRKVGGYHPFFNDIGGEDYHWLFKLSIAGKGAHLSSMLYRYRSHADQTHHQNEDPLKYFFSEIIREVRISVRDSKPDPLDTENELRARWKSWLDSHPSELQFRQASSMLNRNQPFKAIKFGLKALVSARFSFTSWHRFAYLVYSIAMR